MVSSTAPDSPRRVDGLAPRGIVDVTGGEQLPDSRGDSPFRRVVRLDRVADPHRFDQRIRQADAQSERRVRVPLEGSAVVRGDEQGRELADPIGQHTLVSQRRSHTLQGRTTARRTEHRVERPQQAAVRRAFDGARTRVQRREQSTLIGVEFVGEQGAQSSGHGAHAALPISRSRTTRA